MTTLSHLLSSDASPTDQSIVDAWLRDHLGDHFTYKSEMHHDIRQTLDSLGYTRGLMSGPNSVSAATQPYQPLDTRGDEVDNYDPSRCARLGVIIHTNRMGYTIARY
jgi:hypothetical protein